VAIVVAWFVARNARDAWRLTSSVLMTVLMLLSVSPAKLAFSQNLSGIFPLRKNIQIGAPDD